MSHADDGNKDNG